MSDQEETSNEDVRQQNVRFSKELLPCKLLFFFADGAIGAFAPFYSLFYKSSGLSAASIGLKSAISGCFCLVLGPAWGAMLDTKNDRVCLSVVLFFGMVLMNSSTPWIIMALPNATHTNNTNTSTIHNFGDESYSETLRKDPHILFCVVVAIGLISDIFSVGFTTYIEGVIVNVVYTRKTKPSYGQQKVFGPIGFAIGSLVTGVAIDHYRPKHFSPYAASVYVFLPFIFAMLPCAIILSRQAKWDHGKRPTASTSIGRHLWSVLRQPDNVMFFLSVLISGFLYSSYSGFFSLFMNDSLKLSKTMISLSTVVSMFSELLFYPFSSYIIKACGGSIASVFIGISSWVLRLVLTSYCQHAYSLLAIQLLHGACLSLSWTAQVQHVYEIFPKEVTTTALGLLIQLHFSLSGIITNVIGGQVYNKYGGRAVFRGAACVGGGWLIVMVLYFGVMTKIRKRSEQE